MANADIFSEGDGIVLGVCSCGHSRVTGAPFFVVQVGGVRTSPDHSHYTEA